MALPLKKILLILLLLLLSLLVMAQAEVAIKLSANNKEKLTVYHDEPLIVSAMISSPAVSANAQWNREAAIGLQQLNDQYKSKTITRQQFTQAKEKIEASKKTTSAIVLSSIDLRFKTSIALPLKLFTGASQMVLGADSVFLFQWGIDRAGMLSLEPGTYNLNVVIGNYQSNTIQLTILPAKITAAILQTAKMQLALGQFSLRSGDADSAVVHAKNILQQQPSSIDALVLLGDAYVQKQEHAKALKAFQSALLAFRTASPNSPEPPEYIIGMIEWLKTRQQPR